MTSAAPSPRPSSESAATPDAAPVVPHQAPGVITATDRLQTIYRAPGPYASVYLDLGEDTPPLMDRWPDHRQLLAAGGATDTSLDAIEARLTLPTPEDTAAVAVLAGADGSTVVDHGEDPLVQDFAIIDTLPYVAPLLEWQQRRVPHIVVTVDETGADVISFGLDHESRVESVDLSGYGRTDQSVAAAVAELAGEIAARLVVVAGQEGLVGSLADELATHLPIECRVVAEPNVTDPDELSNATVRRVSDIAARTTVAYLRERRFLAVHNAAVDGAEGTLSALRTGDADVLLIHDDPQDQRRAWFGQEPDQLSITEQPGFGEGRLVDAAIRAAVLQGVTVHIIPVTGDTGPVEGAAALSHHYDDDHEPADEL